MQSLQKVSFFCVQMGGDSENTKAGCRWHFGSRYVRAESNVGPDCETS